MCYLKWLQDNEFENRFGYLRLYVKLKLEFSLFYSISEAYLESSRTSTMKLFVKTVNGL